MKKTLFLLSIITVVASCSLEPQDAIDPIQNLKQDSDVIPLEMALANLDNQLTLLYGDTRGTNDMTYDKSSVQVLRKGEILSETRADEIANVPDSLLYLVNFNNENGFAVLSASKKLSEDIFCITESGSISVSDLITAADRLNQESQTRAEEDTSEYFYPIGIDIVPEIIVGSVILESVYGVMPEADTLEDTRGTIQGAKYGPYLKTKWGQSTINNVKVFNRYTPNNYPAGCVAIATAQIMEYRKHPSHPIFDLKACNWNGMETVYNYQTMGSNEDTTYYDQVAHFVREIGKKDNCHIRYGKDGSSGYAEGAQRTFQNYGYRDVDKHLGFGKHNRKIADKCIKAGRPVYLDALKKGLFVFKGHAWVLDGLWGNYYHVNWGWNGQSDGYFKKGVFDVTDRYSTDTMDPGTTIAKN